SMPARHAARESPGVVADPRRMLRCGEPPPHPRDMPHWDHLLIDCRLATLADDGRPYGAIEDAALAWHNGAITYAGPRAALPGRAESLATRVESVDGAWITPGLID